MRTYLASVERPGMPPARYRVSFADDTPHAIAVTRIRKGQRPSPIAISDRTARAAIAAALAQLPRSPTTRDRADPTAPYAALAQMARANRQKEVA